MSQPEPLADRHYDVLIRGGTVLDGSGSLPRRADVGIQDDRIAAIGDLTRCSAGRTIDATGRRVAPGFIDIHTHSDISVLFHPQMESIVSQGVTTQVVGNCSLSLGLATDDPVFAFEKRWLGAHGTRITWRTLREHLQRVEESGVATNYVTLAGQGTLRKRYIGMDPRHPTRDEMDRMKAALAEAMEQGAWGVSTGLEYTPSGYADVDELAELSAVVGRFGGFYATHLRNEGDKLTESVAEAIEIGERAGIPVQLSHHKAEGPRNWGKVHETIRMIDAARARGLDVQMDQYPYTAFQTSLAVQFLPPWANAGDNDAVLARLRDPEQRRLILEDMRANHADWDDLGPTSVWRSVEIGVSRTNRSIQGRTIAELAAEAHANPLEVLLDLLISEHGYVSAVNYAIDEADIRTVLAHPCTMIGSDAVGTCPHGKMGEDRVHPRCYGAFTRVLCRYVREQGTITEADAIRKMTSLPARRLGLVDRGALAPGWFADVVIYDPATITDNATYDDPHRFSTGIDLVLINGRSVWESGAHTGALPGRVLRR